jgi:hypothetical protein
MNNDEFLQFFNHPEVFSPKCPFHWQNSVAKPCHFPSFLMNIFHDFSNNPKRINLFEYWIDFDEANALDNCNSTLTLVSTCVNSLALAFLL